MNSTHSRARELLAPESLGLDTRAEVLQSALRMLDDIPEGTGQLVINLARTHQVDSAGLGALMLIQRRAAERRQTVVLRHPNDELRFLLALTKLDDLFRFEAAD